MPKLQGVDTFQRQRNYAAANAELRFYQRQDPATLTQRADDAYGPDRIYVLSSSGTINSVQTARVSEQPTGTSTRYAGQFRQSDSTARQYGWASILPNANVQELRGQQVTFAIKVRTDGTEVPNIRMAIVEWTGTADTVTSDIVSAWAASPTLIANAAYAAQTTDCALTATYAQYSVTATLGTTFNNLVLFVWTPSTEAQNDDFYTKEIQLTKGARPVPWQLLSIPYGEDFILCKQFCEKSYEVDTAPGTATTTAAFEGLGFAVNATNVDSVAVNMSVEKHHTPTSTITLYRADNGLSGAWTYPTTAANTSVDKVGPKSFSVGTSALSGLTAGNAISAIGHWLAEAEL
jgi:hypothetical protein